MDIVLWKAQFNPLLRITELAQLTSFIYGILTQSIIMRRPSLCPLSGISGLASAHMNLFPLLPSLDPRIVSGSAEGTEGRRIPPQMMSGGQSMFSEHRVMTLADPAKWWVFWGGGRLYLNGAELICGNSLGPCD